MDARHVAGVALVALAGSLATNVYLVCASLRGAGEEEPAPVAEEATPPESDDVAQTEAEATEPGDDGGCEPDLDRCRQLTWHLALRALAAPPDGSGAEGGDAGRRLPAIEQAAALCELAEWQLRERWKSDKAAIILGLRAELANVPKLHMDFLVSVHDMATTLKLPDADRDAIAKEYLPVRAARLLALHEALAREPPDMKKAFDTTKGLFAEEDAILQRRTGEEGVRQWRERQVAPRTVILALLATLADLSWEADLAW